MQLFNKVAVVTMLAAFVAANPIAEADKRQLGGLPTIVCLTGPLGSIGAGILDGLGIGILDCSTGQTCTPLDIPIVGALLPIGVRFRQISS